MPNQYKNKIIYNGNTLIDLSGDTVSAADVAQGKIFHLPTGEQAVGTASGGGGSSSWTKVAETSCQASTTSTSAATAITWATGHSEIWTSDKVVYIRIRDTAGKRYGYFYGTDTFFLNAYPVNDSSSTSNNSSNIISTIWSYANQGDFNCRYGYSTTGYGVYPDTFYPDGRIRIRKRYSSSYSLTIDGTYKIEVYLLDPAGGVPIFE